MRSRVDLPAPLRPTSDSRSPGSIARSTPSRIVWWAVEPRHQRDALVLGHAPDSPGRRESITCYFNLPRGGANRKVAGIVAVDDDGAFYLAHSGRLSKSGFREFLGDGVWRTMQWP